MKWRRYFFILFFVHIFSLLFLMKIIIFLPKNANSSLSSCKMTRSINSFPSCLFLALAIYTQSNERMEKTKKVESKPLSHVFIHSHLHDVFLMFNGVASAFNILLSSQNTEQTKIFRIIIILWAAIYH